VRKDKCVFTLNVSVLTAQRMLLYISMLFDYKEDISDAFQVFKSARSRTRSVEGACKRQNTRKRIPSTGFYLMHVKLRLDFRCLFFHH